MKSGLLQANQRNNYFLGQTQSKSFPLTVFLDINV